MASGCRHGKGAFFPKADAVVLSSKQAPLPTHPEVVGPRYDPDNAETPIEPWPAADIEASVYPPKIDAYAPAPIPPQPGCPPSKYLRPFLAENERLRLSMLWYYTRDILKETELLSGLQEKACLAQESTGWEYVVIGILDVNYYIRLATVGLSLAVLPRGETLCAHTVTHPPGSVFLLPDMMEDWRFKDSPYVESGGLRAYAGAPLRLQNESGDCVGLGSLCVASGTSQAPLTKPQQHTLVRLADWVVADIIQCARARRQRERRRMAELLATAQRETDDGESEEPVLEILRATYPNAAVRLQSLKDGHVEIEGQDPVPMPELEDGLWEDIDYLDEFVAKSNHAEFPSDRVVRLIAAPCQNILGPSLLVVASKDFRLVFDDVDSWFVKTCAGVLSHIWQRRLLSEVMKVKEKFLRGISHQLRTPIHGILGSAELLAEELKALNLDNGASPVSKLLEAGLVKATRSEEPSNYLNTIKTAGRDLMGIVNNMITLNRWADIAMTDRLYTFCTIYEFEAELANEILKTISGDTRYGAALFFNHELPAGYDSIRIDLALLRDSVLPLVINAVQNTSNGVVVVTTSICPDSKTLVVDVEDTGSGIPADHQQRIFEPYEKVGLHSTGIGLGLTLASKFATLLHGTVTLISSDVGHGSHFRAMFQEVECACSTLPLQSLSSRLESLPSKFYKMKQGSTGTFLCDSFARVLTGHGFTPSDSIEEDCFVILEFMPSLEQRRACVSQIRPRQVAICLVPILEEDTPMEPIVRNVVYARGPFLTSKIGSVLEDADKLLSRIKCLEQSQLVSEEHLNPPSKLHDAQETISSEVSALAGSPDSKGLSSALQLSDGPVAPEEDSKLPAIQLVSEVVLVEPKLTAPAFPALAASPKPMALLVDDNVVNLRIMQMYCNKRGLPYCCATDGSQAVGLFAKHQLSAAAGNGDAIQLILMDLQMPVCDGIEATRQIRLLEKENKWGRSALFIVTGQDGAADRVAAKDAGADEYFVKPLGMKTLDRNVKQYFPAFPVG